MGPLLALRPERSAQARLPPTAQRATRREARAHWVLTAGPVPYLVSEGPPGARGATGPQGPAAPVASAAGVAVSYRLNTQSIPAEGFEFVYALCPAGQVPTGRLVPGPAGPGGQLRRVPRLHVGEP